MIKQAEIKRISEQNGVPKSQIDKDWVLSYLLYAIISLPELKDIMIFKGGTCLKKCYFPNYRFSEDLDFTLLDNNFVFNTNLVQKIILKATELSFNEDYNRGIIFKLKKIEETQSKDIEQGYKIYIHYWGADHRKNDFPSDSTFTWHHTVKLDINHTEEIIFPVNELPIHHNYSDAVKFYNIFVKVYSIEEVLSEKLRALIQRKYTSPRDCYDIWYLKNNYDNLDWELIKNGFLRKMQTKNIAFEGVEQLLNSKKERILKHHWNNQLQNQFQMGQLPDYNIVIGELKPFFNKLFKNL